jgi:hypothetical protein
MITMLPAVQFNCKHARRYVCYGAYSKRVDKRIANRRYRRALNRVTRGFVRDPDLFDSECFNTPSLSDWDLW